MKVGGQEGLALPCRLSQSELLSQHCTSFKPHSEREQNEREQAKQGLRAREEMKSWRILMAMP